MAIFHSYVNLPEGKFNTHSGNQDQGDTRNTCARCFGNLKANSAQSRTAKPQTLCTARVETDSPARQSAALHMKRKLAIPKLQVAGLEQPDALVPTLFWLSSASSTPKSSQYLNKLSSTTEVVFGMFFPWKWCR